jgi:opacity protein-like surface antigen
LSASAATAADVPAVLKAPAAPAVYNWTGIYLGGHVGYGTGMKDWNSFIFDYPVRGFLGGGQIGFNQQVGNWVFGIEADASWTNLKGDQTIFLGAPTASSIGVGRTTTSIDRMATVAGRLGFAQDRWLVYVKVGAAWAHETHTFNTDQANLAPIPGPITFGTNVAGSQDRFGVMLGFGSEFALWGNWSFKSQYNFIDLPNGLVRMTGTRTFLGVVTPSTQSSEIHQAIHLAKFGLNYRFGPDAPPAIAPSPPVAGYNWTGAYVGLQGGYGFGRKQWPDFAPNDRYNVDGWLAGATTGANAQAGVFVLGVETEWLWSNIRGGSRNVVTSFAGFLTETVDLATKVDWLSLSSVRAGFVAVDRSLVYVKGGVALAHETHNIAVTQVATGIGSITAPTSGDALHTGYLAGIGVEHAFAGNWSAKLEYNYLNFRLMRVSTTGTTTSTSPAFGVVGSVADARRDAIRQEMHLVKFGINYHFSAFPDAVTARY